MASNKLPATGWTVVNRRDHGGVVQPCDKCGRLVRYSVVMRHPAHAATVEVGASCAVRMGGGVPDSSGSVCGSAVPADAPSVPFVSPIASEAEIEAEIEADEAEDKFGAELQSPEIAVWEIVGSDWPLWLRDWREGVSARVIRRRSRFMPGTPAEVSLRRVTQICTFLASSPASMLARA